jgi:hypothetical protein
MRTIIAMCTMVVSLSLAGLAASTYGYSAPKAPEPWVPVAAENGSHPCLIDYDTLCSVLR